MKYEEMLMEFKKLKEMDVEDVVIADEVYNVLDWLHGKEFENTCKFIKKISIKAQEYSISAIIGTIEMLIYTKRLEISDIIKIKPKEFTQHLKTYIRG